MYLGYIWSRYEIPVLAHIHVIVNKMNLLMKSELVIAFNLEFKVYN